MYITIKLKNTIEKVHQNYVKVSLVAKIRYEELSDVLVASRILKGTFKTSWKKCGDRESIISIAYVKVYQNYVKVSLVAKIRYKEVSIYRNSYFREDCVKLSVNKSF